MRPHRTPPSPLPAEPYWQALPGSRALLHAIAEEPSDDTLRLILADWLEEQDDVQLSPGASGRRSNRLTSTAASSSPPER